MKKGLIKILAAGYVFAAAMLLFGQTGEAYIDPSVMTYVIQAVAGVVIAIGAVVGIYWRKAKRKHRRSSASRKRRNRNPTISS